MVSICRGATHLLPGVVEKAMPSRMPQTTADKQVTRMMTNGGAPHPTRQIQQGPNFCSSCGQSHRLGSTCSKSMSIEQAFAILNKGVVTSGNKRGNPYHDSSTGRFAASPAGGAGSSGGGGLGEATTPNIAAPSAPTQRVGGDIGTANTIQAQAPAAAPSAGPKTAMGKVSAQPKQSDISTGEIAAARASEAQRDKDIEALVGRVNAQGEQPEGPKRKFSHEGAQNAYNEAKQNAMGGGSSEDEAHQMGMQAGHAAYRNALRELNGQPPAAAATGQTAQAQAPSPNAQTLRGQSPPMRAATHLLPGLPSQGTAQPPANPYQSATPTQAPAGAAPQAPGGQNPAGGKPGQPGQKDSFLEAFTKPWANYGTGAAIGGGMFSPGGTVGSTGAALAGSAHGLLQYARKEEPKPAAQQRQQQVNSAQGQSGFHQMQNNSYQNRMNQFAGQAGRTP